MESTPLIDTITASMERAIKDAFAPVARLEMLKRQPFLKPEDVEELYSISKSTLKTWRSLKKGPKFYQTGGGPIRYTHEDIQAFLRLGAGNEQP